MEIKEKILEFLNNGKLKIVVGLLIILSLLSVIYIVNSEKQSEPIKEIRNIPGEKDKKEIPKDKDVQKDNIPIREIGTSKYYDSLEMYNQSKRLENNIWGMTKIEKGSLKSYVYYKSNGNFGWEWDRPDPRSDNGGYIKPIFPEIIVGTIPGSSDYTTKSFPIRYGDINSWTSDVSYYWNKTPSGKYNLAYDIYWLNPDDSHDRKFNIMIWLEGHHDEKPVGTVSDGINEYIHYMRNAGSGQYWEWHAFELKDQRKGNDSKTLKINIKQLIDNVFPKDKIQDDWMIPGVELGSEAYKSSGRIEINKYVVSINGNDI